MKTLSFWCIALWAAGNGVAAPIDFTTGIITGVYIVHVPGLEFQDGAPITSFPVWEFLNASRAYGAQLVPTGSDESNESFAAINGLKELGFASAVSTGDGALEVGVDNQGLRISGALIAFARYYTTIKNNTDLDLHFDMPFVIEPGESTLKGIRDGDTAHLSAGGFIDYRLLSPSGPFGGTYEETTGNLFNYLIDIGFDDRPSSSANATLALLVRNDFELSYKSARLSDKVTLPAIPGHGELTVYYDMYAHLNILDSEVGGTVRLGDPTDLVGAEGVRLVQTSAVPEPATLMMAPAALLGLYVRGRRRIAARTISGRR